MYDPTIAATVAAIGCLEPIVAFSLELSIHVQPYHVRIGLNVDAQFLNTSLLPAVILDMMWYLQTLE